MRASIRQRMPSVTGIQQKLKKRQEGFFPRAFRKSMALPTPRTVKEYISVVLKPLSLWCFPLAALGNEYTNAQVAI